MTGNGPRKSNENPVYSGNRDSCVLTHTLTHTGKGADGNNGVKSAADLIFLEQKGPESVENQGLEGSQSVGKDEVGGSNPPSSSTKHPLFA